METNRTLKILKTYNSAQKNHWQLMCDLSNNDYDINYFSGRESANSDLDNLLQMQEETGFSVIDLLNELLIYYNRCIEDQNKYYDEHKSWNENYKGYAHELGLLMKIIDKQY